MLSIMHLLKNIKNIFLLIIFSISLSGCVSYFRHPNYEFNSPADFSNFDADNKSCQLSSGSEYCSETKNKTVTICVSDGKGGHNCREQAQKKCVVESIEQCRYRHGWRRADANGNYLE
jgi:hypothetical protein